MARRIYNLTNWATARSGVASEWLGAVGISRDAYAKARAPVTGKSVSTHKSAKVLASRCGEIVTRPEAACRTSYRLPALKVGILPSHGRSVVGAVWAVAPDCFGDQSLA